MVHFTWPRGSFLESVETYYECRVQDSGRSCSCTLSLPPTSFMTGYEKPRKDLHCISREKKSILHGIQSCLICPRQCRGRSPHNPGFQTVIFPESPGYALDPPAQVPPTRVGSLSRQAQAWRVTPLTPCAKTLGLHEPVRRAYVLQNGGGGAPRCGFTRFAFGERQGLHLFSCQAFVVDNDRFVGLWPVQPLTRQSIKLSSTRILG